MPYGQIQVDTVKDSLNNTFAPASSVFRNRIINGQFQISQYNGTSSVTPVDSAVVYVIDRWATYATAASKISYQQNAGSVTPPTGFTNYLGATSLSAYTVVSSDLFQLQQRIEGFNVSDLGWGTANAKTVTLSFQVYSSLTGTFGGSLRNSASNRSYPFSYTISSANTWTTISLTIVGDTTGTWLTTNGIGISVTWGMGVGSTYSGTAGSWSANNYASATGATSVVGTSGATFYITGVQLEVGTNATNFDYRPYGTELALCQRYCYQINSDNASNGGGTGLTGVGNGSTSAGLSRAQTSIPTMRTSPTLTLSNVSTNGTDLRAYNGSVVSNVTGLVNNFCTTNALQLDANTGSAYTVGNALTVLWQNSINGGYIRLTAEL